MKSNMFFRSFFLLTILLIFVSSCSKKLPIYSKKLETPLLFPAPPQRARVQFLVSINNSSEVTPGRSKFASYVMGPQRVRQMNQPYTVTSHNNSLFVVDQGDGVIHEFDLVEQHYRLFQPQGSGTLKGPVSLAFDDKDYMYVVDVKRKEILIYDEHKHFVSSIRDTGNTRPVAIAIYNKKLFVADVKTSAVKVYSVELGNKYLYTFVSMAENGKEEGVSMPIDIDITNDEIYILDAMSFRVQRFTHDGEYLGFVGGLGTNLGHFGRPKGMDVDKEGNIYVTDGSWSNIQIFNKEGQLLMPFGVPGPEPGQIYGPFGLTISYENLDFFQPFVAPGHQLKYVMYVPNQFGPTKVNVFGAIDPINITEPDSGEVKPNNEEIEIINKEK